MATQRLACFACQPWCHVLKSLSKQGILPGGLVFKSLSKQGTLPGGHVFKSLTRWGCLQLVWTPRSTQPSYKEVLWEVKCDLCAIDQLNH